MAIEFNNTLGQRIDFGNEPLTDLAQKTIVAGFSLDSFGDGTNPALFISKGLWYPYLATSSEKIIFMQDFYPSSSGGWSTPNNSIDVGENLVVVKYDNSLTTNDPVILINNVAQAITEFGTPSGTARSDADWPLAIGHPNGRSIDGKVRLLLIYNRILTAEESTRIHVSRGRDFPRDGLVFCPFLVGAAGLQAFDGATLAAGNTIVDPCSGAVGVPYGDPVGVGETYLMGR